MTATPVDGAPPPLPAEPSPQAPRIEVVFSMRTVILVYQQVENYLIQPAVMRQAVELSGFATIAVVMVGGALLGVVGAILAVPVAASVKIIVREVTEGPRARMAALREPVVAEMA